MLLQRRGNRSMMFRDPDGKTLLGRFTVAEVEAMVAAGVRDEAKEGFVP